MDGAILTDVVDAILPGVVRIILAEVVGAILSDVECVIMSDMFGVLMRTKVVGKMLSNIDVVGAVSVLLDVVDATMLDAVKVKLSAITEDMYGSKLADVVESVMAGAVFVDIMKDVVSAVDVAIGVT